MILLLGQERRKRKKEKGGKERLMCLSHFSGLLFIYFLKK